MYVSSVSGVELRVAHRKTRHTLLICPSHGRYTQHYNIAGLFDTLAILLLEFHNALAGLSLPGKILAAFFQAVTPRSAGFTTVAVDSYQSATFSDSRPDVYRGRAKLGYGRGSRSAHS